MRLRGSRGSEAVRRIGADPTSADAIVARCLEVAGLRPRIEIAEAPSRARPSARGRWLAGTLTLFPAAFADPLTLAWTVLHELGHAAGLDEPGAEAFAARFLHSSPECCSSP